MAGWVCVECTTVYAVGAPRCPHCRSTVFVEQGEPMPKITVHGGPSNRFADPETAGVASDAPAAAAPAPDYVIRTDKALSEEEFAALKAAHEGGEQSSPGKSSSPSSEKPQTSTEPNAPAPRKRAPGTGSRSTKARTGSSSAPSTAGDPTEATSDADDN